MKDVVHKQLIRHKVNKTVNYTKSVPVNVILSELLDDSALARSVLFNSLATLMAKTYSPSEVSQEFETAREPCLRISHFSL